MKDLKAAVGCVAVSKAGRDKNRCFLICEIVDDEFVLVVDGALRKLSRPKKKKLKHLRLKPYVAEDLGQRMTAGLHVLDSDIRTVLAGFCSEKTSD